MAEYQYIIIIGLFAIISCLLLFLIWREKKKIKDLEEEMDSLNKVPFQRIKEMTLEDDAAYKIIEEERNRIWMNFSSQTELSGESVFELSRELVIKIASIYFPDKDEPLYQATVAGLLHLVRRVVERVEGYLNRVPLTIVRDRTVAEILYLHRGYKRIKDSKITQVLGNRFVNTARKLAWGAYNVTNPWYYGRQIAWTVGKELGLRYLLTLIITIVGEEAVLLYRKEKSS
jgi:hypothetical protein